MKTLFAVFALLAGCAWGQGQLTVPCKTAFDTCYGVGCHWSADLPQCVEKPEQEQSAHKCSALGQNITCTGPFEVVPSTAPTTNTVPIFLIEHDPLKLTLGSNWCDGSLKMGNSTRAVKDVFPLECAPPKAVTCDGNDVTHCTIEGPFELNGNVSSPPPGTSITIPLPGADCDDPGGSAKGKFGKELEMQRGWVIGDESPSEIHMTNPGVDIVGGQGQKNLPLAEPEDVPVIQEPTETHGEWAEMGLNLVYRCSNNGTFESNNGPTVYDNKCIDGHKTTCADKNDILLTSENGAKWCHRVKK